MAQILFLGNCQTNQMRRLTRDMFPNMASITFHTITPYWGDFDEVATRAAIDAAEIVVAQAVENPDAAFNADSLAGLAPGRLVRLPYVYIDGIASLEGLSSQGRPVVRGADQLLRGQEGVKPMQVFNAYCEGRIDMEGPERVEASFQRLEAKEARCCDITITDFLRDVWQAQPIVYGVNHPTQIVMFEVYRRLCDHLGWAFDRSILDDPVLYGRCALPLGQRSLTPFDADRLGLSYGHDSHWYGQAHRLVTKAIKLADGTARPAADRAAA